MNKELENLRRLRAIKGSVLQAMESADPDAADVVESEMADEIEMLWVAELRRTCHLCLPLHGKVKTIAEWKRIGLEPGLVHPANWTSVCHCRYIPVGQVKNRESLLAPLVRVRDELAGNKRTVRAMMQKDIDRALAARDTAMKSPEGRRALRLLGDANEPEFDD